jgi:hypothetical protein
VVAETRDEAITKASAELGAFNSVYIPEQKYVRALLENLHEMSEDGDVVIHWDAIRQRSWSTQNAIPVSGTYSPALSSVSPDAGRPLLLQAN